MTEVKKRNELSIFEELRLKPLKKVTNDKFPKESELKKLNILYRNIDETVHYWKYLNGYLCQVNKYGEFIDMGDNGYDFVGDDIEPKKSSLKKYDGNIRVVTNEYDIPISFWKINDNSQLVQVNNSKEETGIEFKIKAWLRDKAIEVVGLEIRSMKKKAYEYSKDELLKMIEVEEDKLIKKGGWKALKVAALSSLGLSWLPFI
jgi:hypothetical protein